MSDLRAGEVTTREAWQEWPAAHHRDTALDALTTARTGTFRGERAEQWPR